MQRLDRILRRKQFTLPAKLYYLYLEGSNEDGEYLDSGAGEATPVIPLTYDGDRAEFLCTEYEPLANRALAHSRDKKITPVAKAELLKKHGALSGKG